MPFPQQGAARIEAEEARVRASSGDDCDMTLKNNIEGRNLFSRISKDSKGDPSHKLALRGHP